jgi:hypothetical protein
MQKDCGTRLKLKIYCIITFTVAAIFLSLGHYKSTSNDSNYYTDLVIRYHNQPLSLVLTPRWGVNFWSFDEHSYMRDQMPGQLLMGVALTKLGCPAAQALHILEMAFMLLSFFLMSKIALHFKKENISQVLLYSLLLTPLAFSYNIRANHESGIMFFSVLSLLCGLKISQNSKWMLGLFLSVVFLLWIKGPFCLFGFVLFCIGAYYGPVDSHKAERKYGIILVSLIIGTLIVVLSAYLFEYAFIQITGESFFKTFWEIQISKRAMESHHSHFFLIQKLLNFYYYFSHYLAYSLPWSLLAVVLLIRKKIRWEFLKTPLSMVFLLSAMSFCAFFSLSDRTAGRYVIPGYFLISAWFINVVYVHSEKFQYIHEQYLKKFIHIIVPAIWLLAFG